MSTTDPITLEVVKNALASLADEMALVILRSAHSPIVRDSMDYSTALCDRSGLIVAQGLTNPVHLGSFPSVMAHVLERFGGRMRPGDAFVTNDPYAAGGMHLPDLYLIRPVFVDGEVEGYAATLVHHTDVGGLAPGSMALHATEIFQEGLRIPLLKMSDGGVLNDTFIDMLLLNSRMPEQVKGDLGAQIAACAAAERGFAALVRKYGALTLRGIIHELHDYAERLVRSQIAAMPDGAYDAEDFIDGLGETGAPIRFKVRVTIAGDALEIDWEGTSDEVKGAINGPVAITWSVACAAVRCAIGITIPNCAGYMRPITLKAPLGSIVNPRPPAACAARGVMAYRMLDALFLAFAQIVPERMPASGEGGPSAVSLSGRHHGQQWLVTDGVLGSWGGRATKDGVHGIANPGGNLSNMPIELMEARHPVRIEEYGLVLNSGGAGRGRGGMAVTRAYRVLDTASLTVRSDRRRFLPPGLFGGAPGTPSLNLLERDGACSLLPVMPMQTLPLQEGDLFVHIAASGAGWGEPLDRAPSAVLDDVADGRITPDYALTVYGVVLAPGGEAVDEAGTAALRARLCRDGSTARNEAQLAAFFACDVLRAPFARTVIDHCEAA